MSLTVWTGPRMGDGMAWQGEDRELRRGIGGAAEDLLKLHDRGFGGVLVHFRRYLCHSGVVVSLSWRKYVPLTLPSPPPKRTSIMREKAHITGTVEKFWAIQPLVSFVAGGSCDAVVFCSFERRCQAKKCNSRGATNSFNARSMFTFKMGTTEGEIIG